MSRGSTIKLTHFGRKTGKPYHVTIWFAELDGLTWIGSLGPERGWVRNLRASGKAEIDCGDGARPVRCEWVESDSDIQRFRDAITAKHPIMSRLVRTFFEKKQCAFRVYPAG